MKSLYDLKKCETCAVIQIPECPALHSLGVHKGCKLSYVMKSPWKGPLVVATNGSRELAIDYVLAKQIMVEEVRTNEMP
ncbi:MULTISPECIES: FeoA family protein [Bacillaceae]|uniref:Ferrous iron transport protein A n=1 Tax=Evansella alkalicola TaxID=745819 RepID=A0ABS6JT30_9BACI|nr:MULTISPECIES: FeoA family protein [Bacillaceae]MBU9721231.1 ferrous iron transport protein A [Bacillus alkalicola]